MKALRSVAVVVVALGVIFLGAALLQPSSEPDNTPRLTVIPDRFSIEVDLADGSHDSAEVLCEGDIKGTGYLSSAQASFAACTFDNTVAVHRYLRSDPDCAALTADATDLPDRMLGAAIITGIYFDKPITHHIDAVGGSDCERAVWKLLAPLLPDS